jgi:hypothetical protein
MGFLHGTQYSLSKVPSAYPAYIPTQFLNQHFKYGFPRYPVLLI